MPGDFMEKHKRKSIFSALLLFLKRRKGIALLLAIVFISSPFLIQTSALLRVPGVAGFLGAIGVYSGSGAGSPGIYSSLKEAMEKAAKGGTGDSSAITPLSGLVSSLPSDLSSISMITGGKEILESGKSAGRASNSKSARASNSKSVKSIANPDDKSGRETADSVDVGDILGSLGGQSGPGGGSRGSAAMGSIGGFFGGGAAAGSSPGGGGSSGLGGNGPYAGSLMYARGAAGADGGNALLSKALAYAGRSLPNYSGQSLKGRKKGNLSTFAWRNLTFERGRSNVSAGIFMTGKTAGMPQLAETFAMTGMAASTQKTSLETQSLYTGSTYDGSKTGANILKTDAIPPQLPDTGMFKNTFQLALALPERAKVCQTAMKTHNMVLSNKLNDVRSIFGSLGSMPDCCSHGAVDTWNRKIAQLNQLCGEFNQSITGLAQQCRTTPQTMPCQFPPTQHKHYKHVHCSKKSCTTHCHHEGSGPATKGYTLDFSGLFKGIDNAKLVAAGVLIVGGLVITATTGGAGVGAGLVLIGAGLALGISVFSGGGGDTSAQSVVEEGESVYDMGNSAQKAEICAAGNPKGFKFSPEDLKAACESEGDKEAGVNNNLWKNPGEWGGGAFGSYWDTPSGGLQTPDNFVVPPAGLESGNELGSRLSDEDRARVCAGGNPFSLSAGDYLTVCGGGGPPVSEKDDAIQESGVSNSNKGNSKDKPQPENINEIGSLLSDEDRARVCNGNFGLSPEEYETVCGGR